MRQQISEISQRKLDREAKLEKQIEADKRMEKFMTELNLQEAPRDVLRSSKQIKQKAEAGLS